MATPPSSRHTTNQENVGAQPVSDEEAANNTAATISNFLRPNLSLKSPDPVRPPDNPTGRNYWPSR